MLGVFYFHRYHTGKYKSGTYKGLDITLGAPDIPIYFGVLIRSIMDLDTQQFVEGPCRSVNLFLEQFGCTTVDQLVINKELPLKVYDPHNHFYLTHDCDLSPETIHKGSRIGLSDKFPEYQNRSYRFAIMINHLKKRIGGTLGSPTSPSYI
jgi:hypothetical protein